MGDNSYMKPLFKDKCNVHYICTKNEMKPQTCVWDFDLTPVLLQFLVEMRQMTR